MWCSVFHSPPLSANAQRITVSMQQSIADTVGVNKNFFIVPIFYGSDLFIAEILIR